MSLQANINVPGLITLNYPYQGQSITSHVRLAGNVIIPDKDTLPAGTDFLLDQLSPSDQAMVLPSHALFGKTYLIRDITYYMDGVAVRQVDYTSDEIRVYRFNDDYLSVFYGDEISEGKHVYTVVVTAYSLQNPGVTIYDSLELNFVYDLVSSSIKTMLDAITPQPFLGADDHQTIMYALDYVLTKRTEGSLKTDIDFLGSLYDIDKIPAYLLPFLAKTIGYDYFAGLLGNGDSIREELRFLPDWQKSVGTKESILVLLRALAISGNIIPLYLDLQNKTLVTGSKQRYVQTDSTSFPAQTKQARWTVPLIQQNFVTTSINTQITDTAGNVLASFVWDILLNQAVWQTFAAGWVKRPDGTDADLSDIESVYADNNRAGITITFTSAVKIVAAIKVLTTYQYEVETKPNRNTRLSEFFDLVLTSLEKPNDSKTKDYQHAMEIVMRSKPLRTKMRNVTFPVKMADAFVSNAGSVSSTDSFSNPDRLNDQNIKVTEVNLQGIRDSVALTHQGRFADGFLFSWEVDCNLFENRFGIYYDMALDPALYGPNFREILFRDSLVQRGHAVIVLDDTITDPLERKKNLRKVDFRMLNFTTEPVCTLTTDYLGHYHTVKNSTPTSPASTIFTDMVIELDVPSISPTGPIVLFIENPDAGASRRGMGYIWDGASDVAQFNMSTGGTAPWSFVVDTPNRKVINDGYDGLTYGILLIRCPTPADVEALYLDQPNLRNYTFDLNKWYAIWFVSGDFYTDPFHLSVFFSAVYLNHQGTCCNCDLDVVTVDTPAVFNQILGKTYQFGYEFDLEIYATSTNQIVAVYHWNSAQWIAVLESPDLSVVLSPVNGGVLTDDLTVAGTVTYIGAPVAGTAQEWGIRACPRKVGDRLGINLSAQYTDDFGRAMVHGGMLGVIDGDQTFFGERWGDLIPHQHDQGGQHLAAFDGYYLRGGQLLSGFVYHITVDTPELLTWDSGQSFDEQAVWDFASQFQWDVDNWDTIQKVWDRSREISGEFWIHHFPKKQVWQFGPTPEITSSLAPVSVIIGGSFSYTITSSDPDAVFGVTYPPDWLTVDPVTGIITGTPPDLGAVSLLITATNGNGTTTEVLVLTVSLAPPIAPQTDVSIQGDVYDTVQIDNLRYIIGSFLTVTDANGVHARNQGACFNLTTALFEPWNPNLNAPFNGSRLWADPDGNHVYIANVATINGAASNNLRRVDPVTAATDASWLPSTNGTVDGLAFIGSDVYVSGEFNDLCGSVRPTAGSISIVDATIQSWQPRRQNGTIVANTNSAGSCFYDGTNIWIGTTTLQTGAQIPSKGFSKFNPVTGDCVQLAQGLGMLSSQRMLSIAVSEGMMCAVGDFSFPSGQIFDLPADTAGGFRSYAVLATVGGVIQGLTPVNGTAPCFRVIAANDGSGDFFIAGGFTSAGGDPNFKGVIRMAADGSLVTSFSILWGADPVIYGLAVSEGSLVIVGSFGTTVNGVSRQGLVTVNPLTGAVF